MKTSIFKYLIRFGIIPIKQNAFAILRQKPQNDRNNVLLSKTKHRNNFLKLIANYRIIFTIFILIFCCIPSFASTYASLSPVPTEIIYALDAQDNLLGVSTTCNFPKEVKEKPIIGDTYFVNMEKLITLKPDYLFAMTSAKPKLSELVLTETKPIYFEFTTIEDIYDAIYKIAKLTNKENNATKLISEIKTNIEQNKTKNPQKILYIVQTNPLITIGNKSFITDIIKKSGHTSVTEDINHYYPNITLEYALKTKPDVIVVCFPTDMEKIKKLFPNTKFLYLTDKQRDIINRSGPRIYEAIKLFSELNFEDKPTN